MELSSFYKDKRVFITGHTGFKGTWLSWMLLKFGANVVGYSLNPPTETNMFQLTGLERELTHYHGDVRDFNLLKKRMQESNVEIVLHLAAQPLVRNSYDMPRLTYETNVMGTVNLLESIRTIDNPPQSVVNVTTDKVYYNNEWMWGYRERDKLNGFDPYSNSKSCSELVTECYINSFYNEMSIPVSTVRSGNIIGGGDFAKDRIIPDCFRALKAKEAIVVRNPYSIRPYQHVLEPLFAYLLVAKAQYENKMLSDAYNIGPNDSDCVETGVLVDTFCEYWGKGVSWETTNVVGPHEAHFLKLDCSRIKNKLKWKPKYSISDAVKHTVEWYKSFDFKEDMRDKTIEQIEMYEKGDIRG